MTFFSPPTREGGHFYAVWAAAILHQIWPDARLIVPGVSREQRRLHRLIDGIYCPDIYRLTADRYEPIELLAADRFAPAAPAGLVPVQEGAAIRLFWDPNDERDLAGYRVFRREPSATDWTSIGPALVPETMFLDTDVRAGQRWEYAVRALDRTDPPNVSGLSQPVSVRVAADPAASDEDRP